VTSHCLDCGAELHGRYCAQCGQRATPPHPTMREMVIDAWHELTVFDSRLLATVKLLLRRPGQLTLDYQAGKRSRYVLPLRLYLIASVAYFLMAALAPGPRPPQATAKLPGKEEIKINIMDGATLYQDQHHGRRDALGRG
jgi:hypothetical protein